MNSISTQVASGADEAPVTEQTEETRMHDGETPAEKPLEPNFVEQHGPAAEQELSMEQLLASSSAEYKTLRRNEVLDGTIMALDRDGLIVDVGSKSEGVVPASEMSTVNAEERETLIEGAPVLVSVVDANDNNDGHIVLSIDRARAERSWRNLQKQLDSGEVVEAPVVGHNKGGLLVELGGVRGFVPASQVSNLTGGSEEQRQTELAGYNGRSIAMKVIEVNRRRNRLILSERQATQERREVRKEKLLEELREGQVIEGAVTSLADFGAFVDIGGADGLIHLSELSWSRVNHPRDVLKPGDKLEVMVLNVDREHRKIALSSKRTQPEPWSTALDRYELGQMVSGTVTQVAPFGAFVRLEDGIEGLVHVSELSDTQVSSPSAVVKEADVLQLKVIRIDTQRKRIGLSLRQAMDELGLEQYSDTQAASVETKAEPEPDDNLTVPDAAAADLSQSVGSTEMARAFEAAQSVAAESGEDAASSADGEAASLEADQPENDVSVPADDGNDAVAPDASVEVTSPEENLSTQ
ncbi:MAG: S1 RNA-binding domain-containing protein [Chloroflexia bacterium]|nr:S1 RNA-binding domain-containing protein [Chloroflexia bacterium]